MKIERKYSRVLGIEFTFDFQKKKKNDKRKMKNALNGNEVKFILPFKIQTKFMINHNHLARIY